MELIYRTVWLLRNKYRFNGYVHVKAIPGADPELIHKTGFLADRMSVNLELPTAEGLRELAPNKHRKTILTPMRQIQSGIEANKNELVLYRNAPRFVAGAVNTVDYRCYTGKRLSDCQRGGKPVSEICTEKSILFGVCQCDGGQSSACAAGGTAAAAGAPAVSGGLAAEVLWF